VVDRLASPYRFMEMQLPWTLLSSRLFHFQLIPIIPLAFYLKKVYILPSHIIYARQHTVSLENNIQTSRTVVSDEAGDGRSQFQRTGHDVGVALGRGGGGGGEDG